MRAGRQRNFNGTKLHRLPVIELVHDVEAQIVHQIADADRHDDWLIRRDLGERPPIEMVEMRVRYQNEINRGQMMNFEARLLEALNHLQPLRPDRIDQEVDLVRLNQERGVSNPGDADLTFADFRKTGPDTVAGSLDEERRDEDFGEEIALMPVRSRNQSDTGRALVFSTVVGRLANNVPPAFFRKRNRHCCANI